MAEQKIINVVELINNFNTEYPNIIEVKSYFPFGFKKKMIANIIKIATMVSDETEVPNDLIKIDFSLLKIARDYNIFINYTNLNDSDMNMFEVYDFISEKGILKYVLNNIPLDELNFIDEIIEKEINQIMIVDNGISTIISKNLNKDLPKMINKINPDNLKFVAETIRFNNGLK